MHMNWLSHENAAQEFLAMAVLFVGAKLIDGRGAALTGELAALWGPMKAFYVGLFIVVLLLGTAGPTGILVFFKNEYEYCEIRGYQCI